MPSSFTVGKANLEKPANGSFVDTWDVPINADLDDIDACFSASTDLTVTTGLTTLTRNQMRAQRVNIGGTLVGNVTVKFFAGVAGLYSIVNTTTPGAFTVTVTQSVGTSIILYPGIGIHTMVYADGSNVFLADAGGINSLINTAAQQLTPSGMISDFGMSTAPTGWLLCDGSTPLKATYPNLWTAVGTTWGPATSTTFTLPNLQGQFRRGWDQGGTIDPARAFASAQTDEFKEHNHGITEPNGGLGHRHDILESPFAQGPVAIENVIFGGGGTTVHTEYATTGITINDAGTATETRPKNYAVLTCIKT